MTVKNAEQIAALVAQAGSSLQELVVEHGTPFYLYSGDKIRDQYQQIIAAFAGVGLSERLHVHYAVKANDRLGILRLMKALGAGADLVSFGEHLRATRAGIRPEDQVFSGVGKTRGELHQAMEAGIGQINVESLPELHMIEDCAKGLGVVASVAFRLNPDTRAGGHANISTGAAEHKFGLAPTDAAAAIAYAQESAHLHAVGVAIHIGSQITDVGSFAQAFARVNRFLDDTQFTPEIIDLGGGFAVDYETGNPAFDLDAYATCVQEAFGARDVQIFLEPGRFLVAGSGVLIFQTILEKQAADVRWVITDMAMSDLLRPALYQAKHRLSLLSSLAGEAREVSIAGPVCESTDQLAGTYSLPPCPEGTLLALHDTGAYGSVMAMQYNARRLPPELMIDQGGLSVLRRAIESDALFGAEDPF